MATDPSTTLPISGLALHLNVLSPSEQEEVLACIDRWLVAGRKGACGGFGGDLPGKTFAPVPPNFAHALQSREMLQFGVYTHSNRVEPSARVAPLPPVLVRVLASLLRQGMLPCGAKKEQEGEKGGEAVDGSAAANTMTDDDNDGKGHGAPGDATKSGDDLGNDSFTREAQQWCCTVNCYEEGQWIPPHVDSRKFCRPFATLSLESEQCMTFTKAPPPLPPQLPQPLLAGGGDDNEEGGQKEGGYGDGGGSGGGCAPWKAKKGERPPNQRIRRKFREEAVMKEEEEEEVNKADAVSSSSSSSSRGGSNSASSSGSSSSSSEDHEQPPQPPSQSSPPSPSSSDGSVVLSLALPIGSLLVLGDEAANDFLHGVPPVTAKRVSLTFRKLRPEVAAQVTLHRSSQMSKGEAKRQAKAAAKRDKKQARQQGKQQQQQCDVDGGSSGGGGGCGGTIVGGGVCGIMGKSFPVPASMLAPHSSIHSSSASSFSSSLTPNRSSSSSTSSSPSLLPSVLAMPDLEREHVQKLYDRCASQWHGTRYKAWPRVASFISHLPWGSLVCDAGCGNGKNLPLCNAPRPRPGPNSDPNFSAAASSDADVGSSSGCCGDSSSSSSGGGGLGGFGIGCDFSSELVKICMTEQGPYAEALVSDALALPYRTGCFDAVLSIAVLHHISTEARRVQLLRECARVLKVGGRALVYAWARDQQGGHSKHSFAAPDVLVPFHLRADEDKEQGERGGEAAATTAETSVVRGFKKYDEKNAAATASFATADSSDTAATTEKRARRFSPVLHSHGAATTTTVVETAAAAATTAAATTAVATAPQHDVFDETKNSTVLQRYCHVYSQGELSNLVNMLNNKDNKSNFEVEDWVCVEEEYYDTGNWCVVFKKLAHGQ